MLTPDDADAPVAEIDEVLGRNAGGENVVDRHAWHTVQRDPDETGWHAEVDHLA